MADPQLPGDRDQRQRMLAGDPYRSEDPALVADHLRARILCDRFNSAPVGEAGNRRDVLDELLGAFGPDSEIRPPFLCDYGTYLRVGARTFVNFGLVALDAAPIVIGDDVQIGPCVQLLTPTHPIDPDLRRARWEAAEPIVVADNVWLGGGVIVLPGVTIGEDTVVGAGAVVTRDLPAGVVAVGNPARAIRRVREPSPGGASGPRPHSGLDARMGE
jgi:maltose O-acetyltransferase